MGTPMARAIGPANGSKLNAFLRDKKKLAGVSAFVNGFLKPENSPAARVGSPIESAPGRADRKERIFGRLSISARAKRLMDVTHSCVDSKETDEMKTGPDYSWRRAETGVTRVARRAGT